MKKSTFLTLLSISLAVSLLSTTSPAFASTQQRTISTIPITMAQSSGAARWEGFRPRRHWWPGSRREHNQVFCGRSDSGSVDILRGHNLGNTGNQGDNEGFNWGDSTNNGNQLIHQGSFAGSQRSNQFFCGSSDDDNYIYGEGYNQENSGNQGINRGYNIDTSTNNGNQIIG